MTLNPNIPALTNAVHHQFVGCLAFTTPATQQQAQGLKQIRKEDDKGKKGQASILWQKGKAKAKTKTTKMLTVDALHRRGERYGLGHDNEMTF
ncbi:hypothetical protein T08_12402 [Trichinella sp. T8]|nr:hypothetical protein T08_12402 [Trichinella sp. T8]